MANRKIDGRLGNQFLSNKATTLHSSVQVMTGARLHLIVQIPMLNITNETANSLVELRQKEYIDCLKRNLISPHVERIHIFLESDKDHHGIEAQNLPEDWKLHFYFLGRRMRYKDAFQYSSDNLLRRNVMIMNADCYVDKGFEQLDESILNNKTMYALTRHETPENVRLCNARDFCGPRAAYIGSHDAFLFRLLMPLPSQLLDSIDYRANIKGIEQVLIFNFHKYAQFNTKNPCKILHIVHHHCSRLRNVQELTIQGKRIDRYLNIRTGKFRLARFSGL